MLCRIDSEPHQGLCGSGGDLSKYFHRLKQLPEAIARNCFGRQFEVAECAEFGGEHGVM